MTYRKIGALIIRDSRMLLITATADPDVYTMPGGPLGDDDGNVTTLRREVDAELGVHIPAGHLSLFGDYDVTSNIDNARVRSTVTRQIDPAAVQQIAEELMLDHARDIDRLDIHRRLADDPDLSAQDRERWSAEISDLIAKATVTITFPEASGS